jgi:hypothetical protein
MIDHSPVAFKTELFFESIPKVRNAELHELLDRGWNIAFAHVKSKESLPNGKSRFRILAFWEGQGRLGKSEAMNGNLIPLGGIVYIGGYITDVWVAPDMRGTNSEGFSLYRKLREFAARRGIVGVAPGDELTSKSYRAAQARYDYRRASGEN